MKQQRGFTLIELVMVIVILGILAAFALPRFADLGGEASQATVEGARGAVKSASAIAHASCLADGDCDVSAATGETVTLEGQNVAMVFGYMAATAAAVGAAADLADFNVAAPATATTPPSVNISDADDACTFTYTEAADANTPPVIGTVACP